ncbi:(2Fe-2S)-binding protein [Streptomyces enissocaesilis]|uniref:2Fe-2S ferredoxin-type domain-containing protein n=1 Tax=Streptomyces enissocaesilis TaxID=332589 RepID=A0ABN3XIJ8_9ACTN
MSENENPGGPPHPGTWQPTPQGGEYDADATAFVQLPEGMPDFGDPLAAPGHDYVPPHITPQAPGESVTWAAPSVPGEMRWPEPEGTDAPAHDPGTTGQWSFDTAPAPTPPVASELTGQWTVPVADGDLPDESGEFTMSALASQWGGAHPSDTLPGGAPAPWATAADAGGAPAPWAAPGPAHDFEPHPPQEDATAPAEQAAAAGEEVPGRSPQGAERDHPGEVPVPERPAPGGTLPRGTGPEAPGTAPAAPPADAHHEPAPGEPAHSEHPHASYVLHVNGADRPVTDAWIGESLLYVLRERLGLAGAKDGCSQGECGACAVQVDGRLVASCLVPAATTAGSEVRTVEGLATDGRPSDVQRALANCGAVQCGFCVPGMAMTVHDLLEGNHAPTELETRQALCGNLCRCSGYRGVLEAVREVVAEREATAAAEEARIPHQAPPGAGGVQQPHPHEHPHDGGMA